MPATENQDAVQEQIKSLVRKRGPVKSKLTTFTNFVNKIKTDRENGSEIAENLIIQLQDRMAANEGLLSELFEPIQDEIELLCAEGDLEQIAERTSFEDSFYACIAETKVILKYTASEDHDGSSVADSNTSGQSNSVMDSGRDVQVSQHIKLPDIKLPSFQGSHETWLEFRDLFVSLIHDSQNLNDIQKFHYFRASLEGSAAQVIKSLEFSAENYKTAWELVCKRFENKKLLIQNHVEALFNLGKLDKNTATAANMRKLIDTVLKHLRCLQSLEMPTDHWDVLVTHIIAKSLDDFTVSKWEEFKFNKEIPTLQDMFEFLRNRADLLERLELNKSDKHVFSPKNKSRSLFATESSPGGLNSNNDPSSKKCVICSGDHLVYTCQKFQAMSVADRNQHVKRFKLCGPIDLLIGADLFWNLLLNKQISLGVDRPILQETLLGWIVAGKFSGITREHFTRCNFSSNIDDNYIIQEQLARFFEVENVPNKGKLSAEEIECENHFVKNTIRLPCGRFQVSIPFKKPIENLGNSFDQAKTRFLSLERRFSKNPEFKNLYSNYFDGYRTLGKMRQVSLSNDEISCYLPHHGVLRDESVSTRLRIVFDGSAKTSSNYSLNDLQMKGNVIQDDLLAILLRFRQYRYVVTADIEKMYLQVMIDPDQCKLQRVLWREDSSDDLKVFELLTVTFGMTSSPFLAIRCLNQLAHEIMNKEPDVANIILHDFYVDDLATGFDNLDTAKASCLQLTKVLSSGSFPLRKWRSNSPEILQNLKTAMHAENSELTFGDADVSKTLGLVWFGQDDQLSFKVNVSTNRTVTKRVMLSCISRLYDPLGLLSLCIILAKVMLQRLWQQHLDWDTRVSYDLQNSWNKFVSELNSLNCLKIERHVICNDATKIELHGFSDASETAYGACVYILSENEHGERNCHLLVSKGKVAPIKALTIPRLELCAAHVLAKLVSKVTDSLRVKFDNLTFWTDSQIILGWINTSTNLLKPFVRNRVAEIQELTNSLDWRYVPSLENPADLLSRGLSPAQVSCSELWWHGPTWLTQDKETWPKHASNHSIELPEIKSTVLASMTVNKKINFPFSDFSNIQRLKRVVAYILRFIHNSLNKNNRKTGVLTISELNDALMCLARMSQMVSFPDDYERLRLRQPIDKKSKLISLSPFMDSSGLIRVGGRLKNAGLLFNKAHPILLCSKHHLSSLILKDEHLLLLHAGPQQTLYNVAQRFWIVRGRNLVRSIIHKCLTCFRLKSKIFEPIMGNLPKDRFVSGFPFQVTGLDYAGPFLILNRKGRGARLEKGYICLFVCFASKALHLEAVTDLSTDTFLLALKRFISRRGKPLDLFSDNGSNFVGANNELKELNSFLNNKQDHIADFAPHFGGLWEAGVKAVKHHLKRVMGNAHCTYEEFGTLLCQIEAILNSRPLSPLSSDPLDPFPLTPSHFLIGRPATATLEPDLLDVKESRLSRYQRIEKIRQDFWKRWYKEYISNLQQRIKWQSSTGTLNVGQLVLVKDDKLPPLNWRLGRITKLYPGNDQVTRVCDIYTTIGTIKRNFAKVCPLPESD